MVRVGGFQSQSGLSGRRYGVVIAVTPLEKGKSRGLFGQLSPQIFTLTLEFFKVVTQNVTFALGADQGCFAFLYSQTEEFSGDFGS